MRLTPPHNNSNLALPRVAHHDLYLCPQPFATQIPLAKALSEALGCRTFSMEGYEADDVMATLTR